MTGAAASPPKKKIYDITQSLQDMRDSASIIEGYLEGVTKARFMSNIMLQDAVSRRLEIIGEAASRVLTAEQRDNTSVPDVPLLSAYDTRNFYIHEYGKVDPGVMWQTATTSVPDLRASLDKVIPGCEEAKRYAREAKVRAPYIEPGKDKRGLVHFEWGPEVDKDEERRRIAVMDVPTNVAVAKQALIDRFKEMDPKGFAAWDKGGQMPVPPPLAATRRDRGGIGDD